MEESLHVPAPLGTLLFYKRSLKGSSPRENEAFKAVINGGVLTPVCQ